MRIVVVCALLLAACAVPALAAPHALKTGSHGARVRELQRALHVSPVSGHFGPITRRAVKRFQRHHGLTPDGIAGSATLAALFSGRSAAAAPAAGPTPGLDPRLVKIAQCESGGNPAAVSPDGQYRGKYQFTRSTWRRLGGHGDPAKASEAEQDRIATRLLRREGTSPWPSCG